MKYKTNKLKQFINHNIVTSVFCKTVFLVRLSFVFASGRITLDSPTVVCHHVSIPSSLIPFLNKLHVLMESFTVFLTEITKVV